MFSLDDIANSIASATFGVINEKKVRTADMGGKSLIPPTRTGIALTLYAGSATTSDFTAAIIKKL